MSSPGKIDHGSIVQCVLTSVKNSHGCRDYRSCFGFPCNFSTKGWIWYARKTKIHNIFFFNYWIISSPVCFRFTLGHIYFSLKWEEQLSGDDHHARWPLYKLCESLLGLTPRVLTISMGKPEIPLVKSIGSPHSMPVGTFRKFGLWFAAVQFFFSF